MPTFHSNRKLLLRSTALFFRLAAVGSAALLCSCASVKVRNNDHAKTAATRAPKKIYVVPFSYAGARIKEHPMRKNPGQLGVEAQQLVAQALVTELSNTVAPAVLASSPRQAGANAWVVTGEFTRINEGSRILRMSMGLGMGGTKMETNVAVLNGARSPLLKFNTTGGSGAMPGGVTTPVPFTGAPLAALQGRLGVTDDAQRTARVIATEVATAAGIQPKPTAATSTKRKTVVVKRRPAAVAAAE